jgi:hypothetical protein
LNGGFEISGAYSLSKVTDDIMGREVPRNWDQTHALNVNLDWHHANPSIALLLGLAHRLPRTPLIEAPVGSASSVLAG